jgi:zinc transport system substrate-binding protein
MVVLSEAHRFLAQRIGGEAVRVERVARGPGRDPQLPPPRQAILAMQRADRILVNGMGAEPWLEKVSLPAGRVVGLPAGLEDLPAATAGIAHRHGPSGAPHSHGAATIPWLDLEAAGRQAEAIRGTLSALLPGQAQLFRQRADTLIDELGKLDRQFEATTAPLKDRTVLIVGDDLAAFSHRYGLEATVLTEQPEGEPALFLQELERKRGGEPGAVLLLTAPLPPELETDLHRRGVVAVVLQDGLTASEGETFLMQLRRNLELLGRLTQAARSVAGGPALCPRIWLREHP